MVRDVRDPKYFSIGLGAAMSVFTLSPGAHPSGGEAVFLKGNRESGFPRAPNLAANPHLWRNCAGESRVPTRKGVTERRPGLLS